MTRVLILLCLTSFFVAAHAVQLSDEKSKALLAEIKTDINNTLSQVDDFETDDWTVSLARTSDKLIKVGVVIEPSSNTILSVTADGIGSSLGLLPGDVLKHVWVNRKTYKHNFSMIDLTHGDHLKVELIRGNKDVTLQETVSSNFVPRWELYSSSKKLTPNSEGTDVERLKDTTLQSDKGLTLLKKLQERINVRLSEIYRLESKQTESELRFDIHQKQLMETRLGIAMDKNSNRVIRVEKRGHAFDAGLKVGDILTGIYVNENSVDDISKLSIADGDHFRIDFSRDGTKQSASFDIKSRRIPAWSFNVDPTVDYPENSCGVITVFFDPPFTEDIYKAFVTEVNGDLIPKGKRADSITLSAGKHRILIHERIPSRLKRRNSRGKLIEFMVKPNKRYFLGAKYDRNNRFSKQGKYWNPYVWKVDDYECSSED